MYKLSYKGIGGCPDTGRLENMTFKPPVTALDILFKDVEKLFCPSPCFTKENIVPNSSRVWGEIIQGRIWLISFGKALYSPTDPQYL